MKICSYCEQPKKLTDFSPDNRVKEGRAARCKFCCNKIVTEKRKANPTPSRLAARIFTLKHPEKKKEWRILNKERVKVTSKNWNQKNPDKIKIYKKKEMFKSYHTPKGKLNHSISVLMRRSIGDKKAGRHWETLVDFTVFELIEHLQEQFTPEMNWSNHGVYWHIDHIVPIAAFNFETPEDIDFKRCWNLNNFQPLEVYKNLSKGARLEKPFQPSLLIGVA